MKLIPDYGNPSDPVVRARYGYLESFVGMVGNSTLFALKLTLGLLISSVALFGDSLNHLTDLGISSMILLGFRLAKKEADKEHPFGHARAEGVLSVVVASLVVAMGLAVLFASARSLLSPSVHGNLWIAIVVVIFAGVKELMARFAFAVAAKIDSRALRADGWNHRFDALISIAIAGGIYLSTLGGQFRTMDPVLGMVVAVVVILTGANLIRQSGDELLGRAPSDETLRAVKEAASSVEGVKDVHDILVHDYGSYKSVCLHISVNESLSAREAHSIAENVEKAMRERLDAVPIVHVDPTPDLISVEIIEKEVSKALSGYDEILSSHNIQVTPSTTGCKIDMHILIEKHRSVEDAHKLVHDLISSISRRVPGSDVHVHVEPCSGDCEICLQVCSRGFS